MEHKVKNKEEVYGNQRNIWGYLAVGIIGTKVECNRNKKEKARNGDK